MNLHLSGLHAVVTGGSAGIGAAIVRTLASEGCNVSFCARRQAPIDALIDELDGLQGRVSGAALDVTDSATFARWLASIGPFDIFVANVSALSLDWKQTLMTDVLGTIEAAEVAVPILMNSRHAALTFIGSKAASLAAPSSASYGAGKAAVAHYMKSLSARLLPTVRVNTVSPGDTFVAGGLWDKLSRDDPPRYRAALERNPLQRLAAAEEIARVVAFVSSPAASFVAGANWYVDGGSTNHVQF